MLPRIAPETWLAVLVVGSLLFQALGYLWLLSLSV